MPALSFAPALSLLTAFQRVSPVGPFHTLLRTAEARLRPSLIQPHACAVRAAQEEVFARGDAGPHQLATVLRETGRGTVPTIVLGGFVPDATEQVFLLRRFLRRTGDIYYVNYPRHGFSLDLFCAQLDDLVNELARHQQAPVIFSVSFGSGLGLEWLRRSRAAGRAPALAGLILVSPVACVEDLISPAVAKPATLLGRALKPYFEATPATEAGLIEKSRQIFARLFEAGAQNRTALQALMTPAELGRLRGSVMDVIRTISPAGARERVQALRAMSAPPAYFSAALLPLTTAPVLVLFAENEAAVLDAGSPTRFAFESAHRAYFPSSRVVRIANPFGAPVQHASLIFHVFNFLPPLNAFYQRLKTGKLQAAA
jgi:alpha-beta hydrolase superfamily lysophospholipase